MGKNAWQSRSTYCQQMSEQATKGTPDGCLPVARVGCAGLIEFGAPSDL
jgi:hypothetical protein